MTHLLTIPIPDAVNPEFLPKGWPQLVATGGITSARYDFEGPVVELKIDQRDHALTIALRIMRLLAPFAEKANGVEERTTLDAVPAFTLRIDGEPILRDGQFVTFFTLLAMVESFDAVEANDVEPGLSTAPPHGQLRSEETRAPPSGYGLNYGGSRGVPQTPSAAWTGVVTGAERVRAVQALLPSAQTAIEALLFDLEQAGGNNGPPLEDRDDAIVTLRELYGTIGDLLILADRNDLEGAYGLGLVSDMRDCALRVQTAFRDDPVRCSLLTVTAAMATFLAGPVGALAAGIGTAVSLAPSRGK